MKEKHRRYIYETLMSAELALLGITGEESMTEFRRKMEENRTELTARIEGAMGLIQEPDKEDKELPTLQELDDAAIAYSKRVSEGRMYRDLLAGFIAGAQWMAEQLKEDKQ